MRDLFKIATKKKYRFNYKGVIGVEDLWDLSLEDLDKIYRNLKSEQRKQTDDSLLKEPTKKDAELYDKVEIVRIVAEDKLAAKEKAISRAETKAKNRRILELVQEKQDAALKEKSIEELKAMLVSDDEDEEA